MTTTQAFCRVCVLIVACAISTALPAAPVPSGTISRPTPLPLVIALEAAQFSEAGPVSVSSHFVDQVIHSLPVAAHLNYFRQLDPEMLDKTLATQAQQLAFWINIYNGYTQHFLKTDPALYLANRSKYFGLEQIDIAGDRVSLENIEHGVLRRGASIYSLGHLRTLTFQRPFVQRFAVDAVDFRIHFALNCGARSCPPVLPYVADTLDAQLDAMTRDYLGREARYEPDNDVVRVPALLRWFSADFEGGADSAKLGILRRYGVIPAGAAPDIRYRDYDWTLQIENYAVFRPSVTQ